MTDRPEIADALVYAKRDATGMLRLYAILLPSDEFKADKDTSELSHTLQDVIISVNARLPRFKQITDISIVAAPFPRNAVGKLLRDFVV